MKSKLVFTVFFVATMAMLSSGCIVETSGSAGLYADTAPPAPQYQQVAPRAGYVWVRGRYVRRGNRWVWRRGRYVRARQNQQWQDGRWENRNGRYRWRQGRWVRGTNVRPNRPANRCPAGAHLTQDGRCINQPAAPPAGGCPPGHTMRGTTCVPIAQPQAPTLPACQPGFQRRGRNCVRVNHGHTSAAPRPPAVQPVRCNRGWVARNGRCFASPYPTYAPPPRKAFTPTKRRVGHFWVQGHWGWSNGAYVWQKGHWDVVRPRQRWITGKWKAQSQGRWVWVDGRWE